MRKAINIKKPIIIYDDRGRYDSYQVTKLLFKNRKTMLVTAQLISQETPSLTDVDLMINLQDNTVYGPDFEFFIASNKERWITEKFLGTTTILTPKDMRVKKKA